MGHTVYLEWMRSFYSKLEHDLLLIDQHLFCSLPTDKNPPPVRTLVFGGVKAPPSVIRVNHLLISRRQLRTQITLALVEKGPLPGNEVLHLIQMGDKLGSLVDLFTCEQTGNYAMEWREIKDAAGCRRGNAECENCAKNKESISTSAASTQYWYFILPKNVQRRVVVAHISPLAWQKLVVVRRTLSYTSPRLHYVPH